jgi:4-amino-4-deoxy-L-arabinose transferase-like glycosyltransferase
LLVFAFALSVRLVYFLLIDQPPVFFDARRYVSVGLAGPLVLTNPRLFIDSTAARGLQFDLLYDDLIDDEDVAWYPYKPPTFYGAFDDVFFSGPIYPALLGAVFRIAPRYDFWVVRIVQALLDAATAAILFLLMAKLMSPVGGWLSGLGWSLYGPAIFRTGELVTETLSVFFAVAMVAAMVKAHGSRRVKWLLLAGFLYGLLAMTKASAIGLIVPLLGVWLWILRREWRWGMLSATVTGAAALLTLLPWAVLVNVRYERFGLRDPAYGVGNFRVANTLDAQGANLDLFPVDFWTRPILHDMMERPLAYGHLYLTKFLRVWNRASDDYRRGFPFGIAGVQWYHHGVVIFAMIGLIAWPRRAGPLAWLPVSVIAYFVLLHLVMHAVSRYNLVAMPFVIGAAAMGVMWMHESFGAHAAGKWAAAAAIFAGVGGGLSLLNPALWLSVGILSPAAAVMAYWIGGVALVAGGVGACVRLLDASAPSRTAAAITVGSVVAILYLVTTVPRDGHAEWSVGLDNPEVSARRTILCPDDIDTADVLKGLALMDIVADDYSTCEVLVRIGDLGLIVSVDNLVDTVSFYSKRSYEPFLDVYGDRRCDVRSWSQILIPKEVMETLISGREIELSVSVTPTPPRPGGVRLYGAMPTDDPRRWSGPGFTYTAVERLHEGMDPRLWDDLALKSASSRSELLDHDVPSGDDLSFDVGRQVGQYNLLIALLMSDNTWHYY